PIQDNFNSKRHLGIMTRVLTCPSILRQKGHCEEHSMSQIVVLLRKGLITVNRMEFHI
ncbi:mCG1037084, partial [Mus musculus]